MSENREQTDRCADRPSEGRFSRRRRLLGKKLRAKKTKRKAKVLVWDLVFLILACSIGAFSVVSVLIPNGLTSGGVTGIAIILQKFVPLNFSVIIYGLSAVILILVWIFLGFNEMKKILLLSILYPGILYIFEQINIPLLEHKDVLLAAIFCGVFTGVCCGIVLWRGYSFAGSDAIAKIIRKTLLPQVSQSKLMLVIDAVIIVGSAFLFGRNVALYALITTVIISKTIDAILFGFEAKIVQLQVITDKKEEIVDYILHDLNRGVSSHTITGEYLKLPYGELRLLCSPRESIFVRRKIAEIDPKALITVIQVDSVWGTGKGFKKHEK